MKLQKQIFVFELGWYREIAFQTFVPRDGMKVFYFLF